MGGEGIGSKTGYEGVCALGVEAVLHFLTIFLCAHRDKALISRVFVIKLVSHLLVCRQATK
jgi:hypothetical protein